MIIWLWIIHTEIPYSGKHPQEKFYKLVEIRFLHKKKLSGITCWCHRKTPRPQISWRKLSNSHKTSKVAKVFTLNSFLLYIRYLAPVELQLDRIITTVSVLLEELTTWDQSKFSVKLGEIYIAYTHIKVLLAQLCAIAQVLYLGMALRRLRTLHNVPTCQLSLKNRLYMIVASVRMHSEPVRTQISCTNIHFTIPCFAMP